MALNKYAAIRYRIIDQCIRSRSRPYPSKEQLRQACEEALYGSSDGSNVSLSTIEKDIWAMKNESTLGYAPIVYSRLEGGYFYSDPGFSIDLPLNQEDVGIIRLALQTLNHFRDSQIFKDLESSIHKIEARISIADQLDNPGPENLIQFETITPGTGHGHLPFLLDAIRNSQEIEFDYTPYTDPRVRHYQYHPYLLKENKNFWYLVGMDVKGGKIRTLGLDRISNPSITGNLFSRDPAFNPDAFFRYSFGIGTYSGIPEKIELLADEVQSRYILANPLHPTQEVEEEENGMFRIRLEVIPSDELKMQILSYGARVIVLKPEWLRQVIHDTLVRAGKAYTP